MSYPIHKANVSLYPTSATCAAEIAYLYGGLELIHGFSGVLNTSWCHQTFLPSDEFERKKS